MRTVQKLFVGYASHWPRKVLAYCQAVLWLRLREPDFGLLQICTGLRLLMACKLVATYTEFMPHAV